MATPVKDKKHDAPEADRPKKKSLSMHEDVPVWYDCCSCEAEPYWVEAGAEMVAEEEQKASEQNI